MSGVSFNFLKLFESIFSNTTQCVQKDYVKTARCIIYYLWCSSAIYFLSSVFVLLKKMNLNTVRNTQTLLNSLTMVHFIPMTNLPCSAAKNKTAQFDVVNSSKLKDYPQTRLKMFFIVFSISPHVTYLPLLSRDPI